MVLLNFTCAALKNIYQIRCTFRFAWIVGRIFLVKFCSSKYCMKECLNYLQFLSTQH